MVERSIPEYLTQLELHRQLQYQSQGEVHMLAAEIARWVKPPWMGTDYVHSTDSSHAPKVSRLTNHAVIINIWPMQAKGGPGIADKGRKGDRHHAFTRGMCSSYFVKISTTARYR